jgi:hypothetical protein
LSNGTQPPSVGSWVQLDASTQSPLAPGPDLAEQTIGIVRQAFTAEGQRYFQVVWNPGSMFPESGLYTVDQLCSISQQDAANITNQMNAGTWSPNAGTPGSNYQQPTVPTLGLPPALQGNQVTPTLTGPITGPLDPGTGYQ